MKEKNGPFIFCDYWASIMGFKNIMAKEVIEKGFVSLDLFRRGLDRPRTSLPRISNYLLPPRIMISKILHRIRSEESRRQSDVDVLREKIRERLAPFQLTTSRGDTTNQRWVSVKWGDEVIADQVIDPESVDILVSKFLSTWKIVIAFILTILFSISIVPIFHQLKIWDFISRFYPFLFYPLLAAFLYLVFRDFLTAAVTPLPVLIARQLVRFSGIDGFIFFMLGMGLIVFFVQCFFIPKSVSPTLYFYKNDPTSPFFPYRARHAPYWLKGECYWVWRFMTYSPAQLNRFWERDWERIEVWIRADKSSDAGRLEWLVTDYHYRELWYECSRQVKPNVLKAQEARRRAWLTLPGNVSWVVLVDMDVLFHTPVLRGIVLAESQQIARRVIFGALSAFVSSKPKDRFGDYRQSLEDLEIEGNEFFEDVPEHMRTIVLRRLVEEPWSYWRYPRGASSSLKIRIYNSSRLEELEEPSVSDPNLQIKSLG